jgi:RNA polymerase sigma-70 factor (ECF subfamily)
MPDDDSGSEQRAFATAPDQAGFEQFTRRLIGLARGQLGARLQHKVDLEDVIQSVYKSFFLRYGGTTFSDGMEEVWRLLTVITLRKCADRARYHRADCRDIAREVPPGDSALGAPWRAAIAREPTPDQAVVLAETVERLLAGLAPAERPIIELSLQGYTTHEVSERLGRAERSVRRLRERLRNHLERLQDGCEP